jgi:hypothetical protein
MVRHDNGGVKKDLYIVVVQAGAQRNRASNVRESPPLVCAEGNEVGSAGALEMWEFTAIESLEHEVDCRGWVRWVTA